MAYVRNWSKELALELPAATALAIGDVVYINASGQFAKADANAAGIVARPWGVVVSPAAAANAPATASRFADIDGLSPAGSTPACGDEVYLDTTAGGITKTLSTVTANNVQTVHVGVLLSATRCLFDFGSPPLKGQTSGSSIVTMAVVT